MKILVINSGSSSLKFQVIDSETERVLAKGLCERIGIDGRFTYKTDTGVSLKERVPMEDHKQAVHTILDTLSDPDRGVIRAFSVLTWWATGWSTEGRSSLALLSSAKKSSMP